MLYVDCIANSFPLTDMMGNQARCGRMLTSFPQMKTGGGIIRRLPLLDKVSRGHQLVIKSCKAYFTPYRRSSSHSPMAGSPKGETRNASTRAAIQPVCSPAKKAQAASRTNTVHARPQHAPAMQARNESTATMSISARTKGAAIIFKIVRMVHTSYKNLIFASICIL